MAKLCAEDCISMTPYSALAGGRLSKHPGETSKRLQEDSYARLKYDGTAAQDREIIDRVAELAEKHGVSMTEISLAWLLTKVTSPVVGVTKLPQIEGRRQSRGPFPKPGGIDVFGRALCSSPSCRGNGAKIQRPLPKKNTYGQREIKKFENGGTYHEQSGTDKTKSKELVSGAVFFGG